MSASWVRLRRGGAMVVAAVLAAACTGSDGGAPVTGPGAGSVPTTAEPAAAGPASVDTVGPAGGEDASGTTSTVLANGLQVLVTPIAGATSVAIVATFGVGSHHDPPGRSGLAHFAEHLLVTSATSGEAARTVDALVAAYPLGWNAQTGTDYTVVATVVSPDDVQAELARTAARLAGVTPTADDVERERPRILAEVGNMFGGIADLAVVNAAKEQLSPTPHDGRRGGDPDALATISLDELAEWLGYYNPTNAILSVAGPVDAVDTTTSIVSLFESIPSGPLPPAPAEPTPGAGGITVVEAATPLVALGYAAPAPGSDDFVAFLVAASRLFAAGASAGLTVSYAPIDDPDALVVTAAMAVGEEPAAAAARLAGEIERIVAAPLGDGEVDLTLAAFGPLLGTTPNPANPYGTAFAAARSVQLDGPAAVGAGLDTDAYDRVIARTFVDVDPTGAVTIVP